MDELEHSRQTLQTTVDMLKERLARVRVQITNHEIVLADEEAKAVRPLRAASLASTPRTFNCVGWRATAGCGPRGHRVPKHDRLCAQRAPPNTAGYCEVEDVETKERFRVMETSCDSFRWEARLNCLDAHHYLSFPAIANNLLVQQQHVQQQQQNQQQSPSRGIVVVVYPKMLPSAYALLRTLRRLGCQLDVELWYSPDELQDAATHPIVHAMVERCGPVTLRAIDDGRAHGFTNKIHAIWHSAFDHVLFLDADNVPVKDPTYLFELPQFTASGALFWPDFWHPNHTIFAIHERSLVWEYLDLPFVDMFEQESGQLVIDKTRSRTAFALLDLYAYHQPNLFEKLKLVHGDKDLFRFAWLKSNTSFYMVQHPPAVAGTVIGDMFCGQTMAQFDPNGELLFLHRNAKKLEGRHAKLPHTLVPNEPTPETPSEYEVDPEIWTHLQRLKTNATRADYTIEIYKGSPKFPDGQYCYGQPKPTTPHFEIVRFADLPERTIENEIRGYAIEATDLLRDAAATTVKREETTSES